MMRITVVLEYPSEADVPRIGINTTDFGIGKVCAVQFSDALAELEQLHDSAAPQHESQWQPDTSPDPEQWQLVPKVPTAEMRAAFQGDGMHGMSKTTVFIGDFDARYSDTLAAAPSPQEAT